MAMPEDQRLFASFPGAEGSAYATPSSSAEHHRARNELQRYLPIDIPRSADGLAKTAFFVPRNSDEVSRVLMALEEIDHAFISMLVQGWLLDWKRPFDARPIAKVWDEPHRKVNRWALADALSKGKGEGIDDWLADKLLNTNGEHEHQRLCEAAARRLKPDLARKCLYRAFKFMPGHAATGFGICGTAEDVEFLEKVLRDPGFLADVPKAVRKWQVKEIEKAVRRIRRRLS